MLGHCQGLKGARMGLLSMEGLRGEGRDGRSCQQGEEGLSLEWRLKQASAEAVPMNPCQFRTKNLTVNQLLVRCNCQQQLSKSK